MYTEYELQIKRAIDYIDLCPENYDNLQEFILFGVELLENPAISCEIDLKLLIIDNISRARALLNDNSNDV